MTPAMVRSAGELGLVSRWLTPFFRLSEGMPRERILRQFYEPFGAAGVPVSVQLMGRDAGLLAAAGERFLAMGAAGLDLNFGCPSRQVTSGGCGGGALRDPAAMRRLVRQLRAALPDATLSAKIRSGWCDAAELPGIVEALTGDGALDLLFFHYRTVAEGYRSGIADREDRFARLLALTGGRCRVVLNGDLTENEMRQWRECPGVAGVMAARGWLRDPGIFLRLEGLPAEPAETLRRAWFRRTVAACGTIPPGKAIELSNFLWGAAENPWFGALKKERAPLPPEWFDE